MYIFHQLFLLAVYLGLLINCQKHKGNIDSHGLYSSSSTFCSNGDCEQNNPVIVGSIVGGGIGLILIIIGAVICCRRCKGQPSQPNLTFVNLKTPKNHTHDLSDLALFKSGFWSGRYFQFGKWHDFHSFTLLFDPQTFKISGSGSDDIGMFTIDGTYSLKTRRICMMKTYQVEVGTRANNFGYQMIIQLLWNSEMRQFEGKWYVETKDYRGENKFELKFIKEQELSTHEKI